VAAVGRDVINSEIRPSKLTYRQEAALCTHLWSLMRGKRRGSVVQERARSGMLRVRSVDHRQAGVLLQISNPVRSVVGAVTEVRRPILRIISLTLVLPDEFQIAVVRRL
jgi:hypothetical protein